MMPDPGPLLHNSGGAPRTVIRYSGLATSKNGPEVASARPQAPVFFGETLNAVLPASFKANAAVGILRLLGVKPLPDATAQLAELINVRAHELPLPDGCVVIRQVETPRFVWKSPLTALAVLSKCSDSIWLRDKIPMPHAALARRRVTLLVPPRFASRLGEIDT
jgi:hypothetical protein